MPSASEILRAASVAANQWQTLAVAWHVACAGMIGALAGGWRPSRRRLEYLLVLPLLSVSATAWASGNPFNALSFGMLAVLLGTTARTAPRDAVHLHTGIPMAQGALFLALGFVYPHFLEHASWIDFLVAAPLGLLPCPTLLAVSGVTLLSDLQIDRRWTVALGVYSVAYGLLGTLYLGVTLDVALVAAGVLVLGDVPMGRRAHQPVPLH